VRIQCSIVWKHVVPSEGLIVWKEILEIPGIAQINYCTSYI